MQFIKTVNMFLQCLELLCSKLLLKKLRKKRFFFFEVLVQTSQRAQKKHFALRFIALALQEFGVPFMETSARSGLNVELAFTAVAK